DPLLLDLRLDTLRHYCSHVLRCRALPWFYVLPKGSLCQRPPIGWFKQRTIRDDSLTIGSSEMNFRIFLLTLLVAGLTACAPHHPYTDETDTTSEPDGVNRTAPADTSPTLRQEGDRSQLDAYHWTLN